MTPAARVQSAIEVLDQILEGAASEQALTRWARQNRYAGSKDRAAVRDLVYDAMRCRLSFAALGGVETGRGLMIGMMRIQGREFAEVFNAQKYAPAELTSKELESSKPLSKFEDHVRNDLPEWIWQQFQESLGDQAGDVAQELRRRADVFLRVNTRKVTLEQAQQELIADEIETEAHHLSSTALKVLANQRRVGQSRAYKEGLVELQDAASQAVCDFLKLPDSGSILDFCAGGGGKSLAVAARTDARIAAYDASFNRMRDIPARAARAGVKINILKEISPSAEYDQVFCDVPCSGSGSWRRDPDGKWSLTPEKLAGLCRTQAGILDECVNLVSQGGELAYATCSLLADENRNQITQFCSRHPDWRLIEDKQILPVDGGDGFYVARLTRA